MSNQILRRAGILGASATAAVVASVATAGPASADVPAGWPVADDMSASGLLLLILLLPVVIGVVISLLVLLPGVLRGEGLIPKAHKGEADNLPATQTH
ncbi:hypothetical protein FB381_3957 [Nocardioides albertanoniae]|uniref:Secreted protein n=1 Tax=Nocardioides albertanoniae TaxID=1175486 RepID=A0A543ABQ7_9ACTN|nr:hypothetical protein [Nocardioides albertanoniae]TQL70033.1 hypothetical protein FB381_3957 [Nocardioides albertanoniae]